MSYKSNVTKIDSLLPAYVILKRLNAEFSDFSAVNMYGLLTVFWIFNKKKERSIKQYSLRSTANIFEKIPSPLARLLDSVLDLYFYFLT